MSTVDMRSCVVKVRSNVCLFVLFCFFSSLKTVLMSFHCLLLIYVQLVITLNLLFTTGHVINFYFMSCRQVAWMERSVQDFKFHIILILWSVLTTNFNLFYLWYQVSFLHLSELHLSLLFFFFISFLTFGSQKHTAQQVQVTISAEEFGARDKSPYDSYTYSEIPSSSLSHMIRYTLSLCSIQLLFFFSFQIQTSL